MSESKQESVLETTPKDKSIEVSEKYSDCEPNYDEKSVMVVKREEKNRTLTKNIGHSG